MGGGNRGSGVIEIQIQPQYSESSLPLPYLVVAQIDGNQAKVYSHPHQRRSNLFSPLKGFHCLITRTSWGMGKKHLLAKSFSAAETLNGDLTEKNQEASDRQPNKTETLQRAQVKEMKLARKKPKYGKPHLQQTDEKWIKQSPDSLQIHKLTVPATSRPKHVS